MSELKLTEENLITGRHLFHCHFVHHEPYMKSTKNEPGPPRSEPRVQSLELFSVTNSFVLSSHPSLGLPSLPSSFPTRMLTFHLPHACYMSRPSSLFHHTRLFDTDCGGRAPEAWTVFACSNTGIVGSNPTRGMDVYVRLFCVCVVLCVGSGLATDWSPRPRSPTDCV
jgi:hypothetical protein